MSSAMLSRARGDPSARAGPPQLGHTLGTPTPLPEPSPVHPSPSLRGRGGMRQKLPQHDGEAIYFPGAGEDDKHPPSPLRQKAKGNALSPGKGGGTEAGAPQLFPPTPPQPFDVSCRVAGGPCASPLPPSQNTHIAGIPLLSDR